MNYLKWTIVPLLFLIISLYTISDYGINWDEPKHLLRGQAYLHFILTGRHDYLDLPVYPLKKGAPDYVDFNLGEVTNSAIIKPRKSQNTDSRSYFQSDFYDFNYFLTKHVHTHPEVNDLLAACFNFIFYQKFAILGDIESHNLFIFTSTFLLILALSYWVYHKYGFWASLISSSSLAFYPLVFSESHFNIKDPVSMSFIGLSIISFWFGIKNGRIILLVLSAISTGLALGTKFNVVFLPFILGPWLGFIFIKEKKLLDRKIILTLLFFPIIVFTIFYLLSPYLWGDPARRFLDIVKYYQEIGAGTPEDLKGYFIGTWDIYPMFWIIVTTPISILILTFFGLIYSFYLTIKKRDDFALLILLWFFMPILRVTWPGANIYGGVRQIMEYIPAMAVLAGIGGNQVMKEILRRFTPQDDKLVFKNFKLICQIGLLGLFLILTAISLLRYHPFENTYFNELVGGLSGAKEKQIPSWGNTYGNAYLQGIYWLNSNAEKNAKLALPINYISTIPRVKLRDDIGLDNDYFSGPNHQGEYAMELSYDWPLAKRYKYSYYENFLNPVYQVLVDNVAVLKIWKNDLRYSKPGFDKITTIKPAATKVENSKILIDLGSVNRLVGMTINHGITDCNNKQLDGFIEISEDGQSWTRKIDPLIDPEFPKNWMGNDLDSYVFMFAGDRAQFISLNLEINNLCIIQHPEVLLKVLN